MHKQVILFSAHSLGKHKSLSYAEVHTFSQVSLWTLSKQHRKIASLQAEVKP